MKLLLRRATVSLAVLGAVGVIGSLAVGRSMKHNRNARAEYFSRVVIPAEKTVREDWEKQRAALEAEAAKHPGTIARLPLISTAAVENAQKAADTHNPPYFRLARYQELFDVLAVGSLVLCLFSSTALELVRRREAKA